MKVDSAYSSDNQIFIAMSFYFKDSDFSRVEYTQANWTPAINSEINLTKNLVVPLQVIQKDDFEFARMSLTQIKVLDQEHWMSFRKILAENLATADGDGGVVIRQNDQEVFLYYDKDGLMKVVDVRDKPRNIPIKITYTQEQIADRVIETLKTYLKNQKIEEEQVLFTTEFGADYVAPLLYVDFKSAKVINLEAIESEQSRKSEHFLTKGIKTADRLVLDSHLLGMATRPVSSTFRLFSWTKSATIDAVNPLNFRFPGNNNVPDLYQGEGMDLKKWEKKLNRLFGRKSLTSGNMKFLIGGDQFFPRLIEAIQSAHRSIEVRIFIFDNDDYAVKIADILKKKSKEEGMEVKILIDGMGLIMGQGKVPDDLPEGFIPPASIEKYLTEDSNIQLRIRPNTWFKADHTKTIVIDHEIAFSGGMNIGREYRYDWHDLMMEMNGPVIQKIDREFNIAWAHASAFGDFGYLASILKKQEKEEDNSGYPIRLLFTRANESQIFKAQVEAIKRSKKYIYINNAYFSDNTILNELIAARRRGVDVRVILPVNGNHEIMNASNAVTANAMFRNGIRVYFYPGMSHIKAAIYDGWLCTGTANFDKLSLVDNLELNFATSHQETVEKFRKMLFEKDFEVSMEMNKILDIQLKSYVAEFFANQL